MSSDEKSASSPTKSDGSPQNTIRVIKKSDADTTVVEVKVAGEDGAKVTVFGGDGPVMNGISNKTNEKQPEINNKVESKTEDQEYNKEKELNKSEVEKDESKELDNENQKNNDDDDDNKPLEPLTKEEIDKIVSKYSNKFKKADLDKYLKFFWSVDEEGFGIFGFRQLVYRLWKMGRRFTIREIAKMFVDVDHDNDNLVSLDEFLDEMSKEKPRPKTEEEWKATFEKCDKNKDGFICKDDIAAVMRENNVQFFEFEIDSFLRQNGKEECEKLNFSDFKWALKR